jgi:hypothetical protein
MGLRRCKRVRGSDDDLDSSESDADEHRSAKDMYKERRLQEKLERQRKRDDEDYITNWNAPYAKDSPMESSKYLDMDADQATAREEAMLQAEDAQNGTAEPGYLEALYDLQHKAQTTLCSIAEPITKSITEPSDSGSQVAESDTESVTSSSNACHATDATMPTLQVRKLLHKKIDNDRHQAQETRLDSLMQHNQYDRAIWVLKQLNKTAEQARKQSKPLEKGHEVGSSFVLDTHRQTDVCMTDNTSGAAHRPHHAQVAPGETTGKRKHAV